jgi:hypothetical protein
MDLQKMLDDCKISPKLLNYIENFNYPYVNDVQMFYEQLLKIGQGTFGFYYYYYLQLTHAKFQRSFQGQMQKDWTTGCPQKDIDGKREGRGESMLINLVLASTINFQYI